MLSALGPLYGAQIQTIQMLSQFIHIILNILFAGAVARDAASLNRLGLRPALVSATTWAFATLIGGIITAAIYWFIHHSTLTRSTLGEKHYDRP